MPASRSYTDAQNTKARNVVAELVQRMGNQRRVADALNITQPALSAFMLGKYGIGPAVMKRLAALAGLSERQLLGEDPTEPVVRDEYPNRAVVVEFARRIGYGASVIERLMLARPMRGGDVPAIEWARLLVHLDALEGSPLTIDLPAAAPRKRANRRKK